MKTEFDSLPEKLDFLHLFTIRLGINIIWPSVSKKGLHSLLTVRFSEVCPNPFVTKVVRTLHGESIATILKMENHFYESVHVSPS